MSLDGSLPPECSATRASGGAIAEARLIEQRVLRREGLDGETADIITTRQTRGANPEQEGDAERVLGGSSGLRASVLVGEFEVWIMQRTVAGWFWKSTNLPLSIL
jgi:hypothetical protein